MEGIFCAGVDHHATALAERERLVSLAGERLTPHLIEHNGAEEVVFLSTCNRVEIYGVSSRRGPEITEALGKAMPEGLGRAWRSARGMYLHQGLACWRHLSEVATGLCSMVVGEAEILGQVRAAYQGSRELGGTGKAMHGLFQSALRAARAARQAAGFGKADPSVGRCAAEALAEELGGEAVVWGQWTEAARACGVLASALRGGELPWEEVHPGTGPAALVDLGVPRTLTRLRRSYPQAVWLDLEELAKRSEVLPESLGSIHRAEEVLRAHEKMWVGAGAREKSIRPSGG